MAVEASLPIVTASAPPVEVTTVGTAITLGSLLPLPDAAAAPTTTTPAAIAPIVVALAPPINPAAEAFEAAETEVAADAWASIVKLSGAELRRSGRLDKVSEPIATAPSTD